MVIHPSGAPAYALRVACEDPVIAYSGDPEWTDALIRAADCADLFVCKADFFEKKISHRRDDKTLMSHRSELTCRRLILIHMSDDMLRRLPEIDSEWADDGKLVVL